MREERAVLGGGCFWCIEAAFHRVRGVLEVCSGYAGGEKPNPTYEEVCGGTSGHIEVVEVRFNPDEVTYKDILQVFFTVHDPTSLDRQGADAGSQYRSIIFWTTPAQREAAEQMVRELDDAEIWPDPIVTQIQKLDEFYPAEEYHQRFYEKNPNQGYCQAIIAPKLARLRQKVAHLYREAA